MAKMFFVDLTRCTACRGCQVACKQWKNLPAEKTVNTGSHQNPPDLSFNTLKTVHFAEKGKASAGNMEWLFFPEQCRHCTDPPCLGQADADKEGAVIQDAASGAVLFTDLIDQVDGDGVRAACPYDIPRRQKDGKRLSKCDMCIDRVREGKLPACVLSCPTSCMHFGEEKEMEALAKKRLEEVKKKYPKAALGDPDSVRVVYLFQEDPRGYHPKAVADISIHPMSRRQIFARTLGLHHGA
jgi:formate dehydrogenase iron-sulfur subunit